MKKLSILLLSILVGCSSNSTPYDEYIDSKRSQNIGICRDASAFISLMTVATQEGLVLENILHSNDENIKMDLAKIGCFNAKLDDFIKANQDPVSYSRVSVYKNVNSVIQISYFGLDNVRQIGYVSEKDFLTLIILYQR